MRCAQLGRSKCGSLPFEKVILYAFVDQNCTVIWMEVVFIRNETEARRAVMIVMLSVCTNPILYIIGSHPIITLLHVALLGHI